MTIGPAEVPTLTRLAMTAWWTAAARALESGRSDCLFDDPLARLLVGQQGVDEYQDAVRGNPIHDLHAVITRFFDDFLSDVTHTHGIRQVVVVAAGLDTRAFRLAWPSDTRVFEIDQHHVIAYKNCILSLQNARPRCDRHTAGIDLTTSWARAFLESGFRDSDPSVWLIEESLYFFDQPAVRNLLATIASLSARGSWLGFDIVNSAMLTSSATRHWHQRMIDAGTPWLFTADSPETFLAELGWSATVVEPGAGSADFGRYPYPIRPRDERDAPRSFLVTAVRR